MPCHAAYETMTDQTGQDDKILSGQAQLRSFSPRLSSGLLLADGSPLFLTSVAEEDEAIEQEEEEHSILLCQNHVDRATSPGYNVAGARNQEQQKSKNAGGITAPKLPPIGMRLSGDLSSKPLHDDIHRHSQGMSSSSDSCDNSFTARKNQSPAPMVLVEDHDDDSKSSTVLIAGNPDRELTEKEKLRIKVESLLLTDSKGNLFTPAEMSQAGRYQPQEKDCEAFRPITFNQLKVIHDSSGRIGSTTDMNESKKSTQKISNQGSASTSSDAKKPSPGAKTFLADTIIEDIHGLLAPPGGRQRRMSIGGSIMSKFRRHSITPSLLDNEKLRGKPSGGSLEQSLNKDDTAQLPLPKRPARRFSIGPIALPRFRSRSCGPSIIGEAKPPTTSAEASGATTMGQISSVSETEKLKDNEKLEAAKSGAEKSESGSGKLTINAVARMKAWKTKMEPQVDGGRKSLAQDDLHLLQLKKHSEDIAVEIPMPMKVAIFDEIYPIIQNMTKLYWKKLGRNHPLTKEAMDQLAHMDKIHSIYATL